VNNKECPVCSSSSLDIADISLDGSVTSDGRYIGQPAMNVYCGHCGYIFVHEQNRPAYEEFYARDYNFLMQSESLETVNMTSAQKIRNSEYLAGFFSEFVQNIDDRTLFDIGSGKGNFLDAFNQHFPKVGIYAMEPSGAYEVLRTKSFLKKHYNAFFEADGFSGQQFDYISLIGVLEHVADTVSFLKSISRIMHSGSCLLLQVPNFRNNKYDLLVLDHLSKFTPESIRNVFSAAGFKVVKESVQQTVSMEYVVVKYPDCRIMPFQVAPDVAYAAGFLKTVIRNAARIDSEFAIYGQGIVAQYLLGCGIFRREQIKAVIDDNHLCYGHLWNGFVMIVGFEEFESKHRTDVIFLAMNPCYHRRVMQRLGSFKVYGLEQ